MLVTQRLGHRRRLMSGHPSNNRKITGSSGTRIDPPTP